MRREPAILPVRLGNLELHAVMDTGFFDVSAFSPATHCHPCWELFAPLRGRFRIETLPGGGVEPVPGTLWRSADEGDTWTPEGYLERSFRYDRQGSMVKIGGNAALYAHQKARVLLLTGNELHWIAGCYESTKRFSRMYYRLSFDSGLNRYEISL